MKRSVLGFAVAALIGCMLVGGATKADASYVAQYQSITVWSSNWCFSYCLNMNRAEICGATAGGYGFWDLVVDYNWWNEWYAVIVFDYWTGQYEDVFYSIEDNL